MVYLRIDSSFCLTYGYICTLFYLLGKTFLQEPNQLTLTTLLTSQFIQDFCHCYSLLAMTVLVFLCALWHVYNEREFWNLNMVVSIWQKWQQERETRVSLHVIILWCLSNKCTLFSICFLSCLIQNLCFSFYFYAPTYYALIYVGVDGNVCQGIFACDLYLVFVEEMYRLLSMFPFVLFIITSPYLELYR